MKDWRNTSGGDVSSTSRTSQSLTNSSQALRTASSSSSVLCRSSHSKISKLSGTLTFHSLENPRHAEASRKGPNSTPKYDFRLKEMALFVLSRLAQFWTAKRSLVDYGLARAFLAQRDGLKRCASLDDHSLSAMHNSSFFHILPRAQSRSVALNGWLAKPEDWLSERVKINTSQTGLVNLKLRENDY